MNYGLILAGGVGQRMRSTGMPKQFLELFHKPIIVYTLEKFEKCSDIDQVIVVCTSSWIDYMKDLIRKYELKKVVDVVSGGRDRQKSIEKGVLAIDKQNGQQEDIVVIHDGVRPLVSDEAICENIRIAKKHGCAMTVFPVQESVVVTKADEAGYHDFMKRDDTYVLTSPQTFKLGLVLDIINKPDYDNAEIPLIDAAIAYASMNNKIPLVKENNKNIKITTPEDYYILKALIELEENRSVFGL